MDAGSDLWDRDFDAESLVKRDLSDDLCARDFEDAELFGREVEELAARELYGRDTQPRPIRPRPAPITITVQPPTPPGSGANSPARHGKTKREDLYDELVPRARSRRDTQPRPLRPPPAPITITVQPPTPPGSGANSPARHAKSRRDIYDELVARELSGRDTQPRPIRPRPAPITITVQPPTPPGSGANSPARHGKSKREVLYDALVARMDSVFDELD